MVQKFSEGKDKDGSNYLLHIHHSSPKFSTSAITILHSIIQSTIPYHYLSLYVTFYYIYIFFLLQTTIPIFLYTSFHTLSTTQNTTYHRTVYHAAPSLILPLRLSTTFCLSLSHVLPAIHSTRHQLYHRPCEVS